jgi:hypothetical protein
MVDMLGDVALYLRNTPPRIYLLHLALSRPKYLRVYCDTFILDIFANYTNSYISEHEIRPRHFEEYRNG